MFLMSGIMCPELPGDHGKKEALIMRKSRERAWKRSQKKHPLHVGR